VYVVVVSVDLFVLAFVVFAIARTIVRRRRHPELPPTPEALAEMRREDRHDTYMPNSGWNGVWY